MAISQAMCTSFKKELLEGVHNFKNSGGSTFNLALYTSSASLGAASSCCCCCYSAETALKQDCRSADFGSMSELSKCAGAFCRDFCCDTSRMPEMMTISA